MYHQAVRYLKCVFLLPSNVLSVITSLFIGENTTCYFHIISEYFGFINLLIKIHTHSTGNFNRSSALAESAFNDLLTCPNPFTEINILSVVTLE